MSAMFRDPAHSYSGVTALSDLIHDVRGVEIITPQAPNLGAAALWYAVKWQWPVHPLHPRGKAPLTQHGLLDATCDPAQIREWWTRWPDANIGVPTGPAGCGFDVIDADGAEGAQSFEALSWVPEIRAIAFTPGDPGKDRAPGRHYFIDATGDGNGSAIAPGLDYRGLGGFVVAAPSIGPHGVGYTWIERPAGKP